MSANESADDLLASAKAYIQEARRKERPDYHNIVYCDRHLGVPMRLEILWFQNEYQLEGLYADFNPLRVWRCTKPECDRFYEPTMFGYHANNSGDRLNSGNDTQPRGNHAGLPFMYIAKTDSGRRYKCPYYKCVEQGPIVAASTADEEVNLAIDPLAKLKKVERQCAEEMRVFQEFALAAGLRVEGGSPENKEPPHPDILCSILGQKHWFELGQIIHEDVANRFNSKRPKPVGGFSVSQDKPFLELILKKTDKNYTTEDALVDLILHFGPQFATSASVKQLAKKYKTYLDSLILEGPFNQVWIFDENTKEVVWRS
jgi:hypothetical protein